MSHFTIGIIVPAEELSDLNSFIEQQLAPFDEAIKVAPYVSYSLEKAKQALDELQAMTPEDRYAEYLRGHTHFNAQGEPLSRYNPASKWDWYEIGGRWNGWLHDRDCKSSKRDDNIATVEHVIARDKIPFALVTPDGSWHEQGQMGWWGAVIDGKETVDTRRRAFELYELLLAEKHGGLRS